jgi:hypothetical protein
VVRKGASTKGKGAAKKKKSEAARRTGRDKSSPKSKTKATSK